MVLLDDPPGAQRGRGRGRSKTGQVVCVVRDWPSSSRWSELSILSDCTIQEADKDRDRKLTRTGHWRSLLTVASIQPCKGLWTMSHSTKRAPPDEGRKGGGPILEHRERCSKAPGRSGRWHWMKEASEQISTTFLTKTASLAFGRCVLAHRACQIDPLVGRSLIGTHSPLASKIQ